jgi:NADPH:quinone reductase
VHGIQASEFGGPEVLRYRELPVPEPGAGQVRVRLHAVGVNPADTYIRTGTYAFFKPELPYTPGFDGAGVVDEVGAGVEGVGPGDRVFLGALGTPGWSGAYAELAVVDAAGVHPLPPTLSYGQGAAVGVPCVTAWRALFQKAGLRPGETVLIHGASGGVGVPATQLASDAGAVVIGTAGSAAGAEVVRDAGASHVLDHSAPGYLEQLPDLTGGRGVSVVVEMLADVNLEQDLGVLAVGGTGGGRRQPWTPGVHPAADHDQGGDRHGDRPVERLGVGDGERPRGGGGQAAERRPPPSRRRGAAAARGGRRPPANPRARGSRKAHPRSRQCLKQVS